MENFSIEFLSYSKVCLHVGEFNRVVSCERACQPMKQFLTAALYAHPDTEKMPWAYSFFTMLPFEEIVLDGDIGRVVCEVKSVGKNVKLGVSAEQDGQSGEAVLSADEFVSAIFFAVNDVLQKKGILAYADETGEEFPISAFCAANELLSGVNAVEIDAFDPLKNDLTSNEAHRIASIKLFSSLDEEGVKTKQEFLINDSGVVHFKSEGKLTCSKTRRIENCENVFGDLKAAFLKESGSLCAANLIPNSLWKLTFTMEDGTVRSFSGGLARDGSEPLAFVSNRIRNEAGIGGMMLFDGVITGATDEDDDEDQDVLYSVRFGWGKKEYFYYYEKGLHLGDSVVVPVGKRNVPKVAFVTGIGKKPNDDSPFRIKRIICEEMFFDFDDVDDYVRQDEPDFHYKYVPLSTEKKTAKKEEPEPFYKRVPPALEKWKETPLPVKIFCLEIHPENAAQTKACTQFCIDDSGSVRVRSISNATETKQTELRIDPRKAKKLLKKAKELAASARHVIDKNSEKWQLILTDSDGKSGSLRDVSPFSPNAEEFLTSLKREIKRSSVDLF